jgi:hypothetical protein
MEVKLQLSTLPVDVDWWVGIHGQKLLEKPGFINVLYSF